MADPGRWAGFLAKMRGKRVWVTISPETKQRSLPQNAYFHGPVLDMIEEWSGNDRDEIKSDLKDKFLSYTKTYPNGETLKAVKRTRDLNTVEWEEFMTKIRACFDPYLYIPEPNEYAKHFEWSGEER